MKQILVSGGFGFIGSHLLELLLADPENRVTAVDSGISCPVPPIEVIKSLPNSENLTYCPTSIWQFLDCPGYYSHYIGGNLAYEEVYHLASVVGPVGVLQYSGKIAQGVIADAIAIADFCLRTGARFLNVSTSECYGGGQSGLCDEAMECRIGVEPSARLEYAVGKLAAEVALRNLARDKGLDVRIVRPFNVTGPRQSPKGGFVLPRFVLQALMGKPLTIYGDGSQIRAFTHVRDIVQGLVLAMEKGRSGAVYNLGNPENKCSIRFLAETVLAEAVYADVVTDDTKLVDLTKQYFENELRGQQHRTLVLEGLATEISSAMSFVDPKTLFGERFEEANDKFPDATKAMTELGWTPTIGKVQIVRDVIDYWRALRETNLPLFKQLTREV